MLRLEAPSAKAMLWMTAAPMTRMSRECDLADSPVRQALALRPHCCAKSLRSTWADAVEQTLSDPRRIATADSKAAKNYGV